MKWLGTVLLAAAAFVVLVTAGPARAGGAAFDGPTGRPHVAVRGDEPRRPPGARVAMLTVPGVALARRR